MTLARKFNCNRFIYNVGIFSISNYRIINEQNKMKDVDISTVDWYKHIRTRLMRLVESGSRSLVYCILFDRQVVCFLS